MSTKNMTDAEFEAYMEEKEYDRLYDPDGDEDEDMWADYDDCPMDGDHDSALASCGWGTDEDYGYYGGDEW